jgi:AcrR family transcriptional regulator
MNNSELDAKTRIVKATMDILNEIHDIDKITVRQIAEKANVGVGLVNYHFRTKENLIQQAIGTTMGKMADTLNMLDVNMADTPEKKLKTMLKKLSDFGVQYSKFMKVSIAYELQYGNMQAPLYLVPVLREIFGKQKDEIEIRIIALQILTTMQSVYLRSTEFQLYTGMDINNAIQRNKLIDMLVDNVIKK